VNLKAPDAPFTVVICRLLLDMTVDLILYSLLISLYKTTVKR